MKRLLLFGACLLTPFSSMIAQEATRQEIVVTPDQKATHKAIVNIKIDPLSNEQIKAGLTPDGLRDLIQQQLESSGITVDDTIPQPVLMLRIRTIEAGFDYATFFQLSLHEESMLVRNRSVFNAITWSQASMLCCRPEDLKKEVDDTVSMMVQTFSKEYLKSLQPS